MCQTVDDTEVVDDISRLIVLGCSAVSTIVGVVTVFFLSIDQLAIVQLLGGN